MLCETSLLKLLFAIGNSNEEKRSFTINFKQRTDRVGKNNTGLRASRNGPYKVLFRAIAAGMDAYFCILVHVWLYDHQVY
jgi:hypothetical protein